MRDRPHRPTHPYTVMTGLVPVIHDFLLPEARQIVDGRDKPGHDGAN